MEFNDLTVSILGFTASVVSFIMFAPQAITVWRHRKTPHNLKGVSIVAQWMLLLNAILWGLYALLTGAYWSGVPGLFNAPLAIWMIVQLLQARESNNKTALA